MDLTQLEMLNTVVKAGSIIQAVIKMHRVSSNPTTRLCQLGTELRADLFIREDQCLRLLPTRYNFLCYNQQALVSMDEVRNVVAGDKPQGSFPPGPLESTVAAHIPATLAESNRRYPKIQFSLFTGLFGAMLEGVLEGKLSTALIDGSINCTAIGGISAYREGSTIVTPQGHASVIRASQVNGNNVYVFRANCSYHRHFESWFHADGTALRITHEVESYHGMLTCMIVGVGTALIPRSMPESIPGHHQVETRSLAEQRRRLTAWPIWRCDARTCPLEIFTQLLDAFDSAK